MDKKGKHIKNSGQTMILTTIITGGIVLSASVIAGMLMFYQLREINDTAKSAMALFAADAGTENSLFCYFKTAGTQGLDYSNTCSLGGGVPNGASYETRLTCVDSSGFAKTECLDLSDEKTNVYGIRIKSIGKKDKVERVVDSLFGIRFN